MAWSAILFLIDGGLELMKKLLSIFSKYMIAMVATFAVTYTVSAQTRSDGNVYEEISGLTRQAMTLQVTLGNGATAQLDAFVTRPSGSAKYPVALITNGTDGNARSDRIELNPNRFSAAAIAFARHGYASVVVLRQGYGRSTGTPEYQGGTCRSPRHFKAGKAAAGDITAALIEIRKETWASADDALLVGMSSGGFSVLAAGATNPQGVRGVIAFDPGRGARQDGLVCDEAGLLDALSKFGHQARIPALWIYSANDTWFPPTLGRKMWTSYKDAGGRADLFIAPPFANNGHTILVSAGEDFWWGRVKQFLQEQALPTDEIVKLPTLILPAPPGLNAAGHKAFQEYEKLQSYEKAFASNGEGVWGSARWARTKMEAAARAVTTCNAQKKADEAQCRLYAVGNALVSGGTD